MAINHLSACVCNVQIILRDLQPREENHDIDAVVTMKRYPPFQGQRHGPINKRLLV